MRRDRESQKHSSADGRKGEAAPGSVTLWESRFVTRSTKSGRDRDRSYVVLGLGVAA
jgi:hypothetical protein